MPLQAVHRTLRRGSLERPPPADKPGTARSPAAALQDGGWPDPARRPPPAAHVRSGPSGPSGRARHSSLHPRRSAPAVLRRLPYVYGARPSAGASFRGIAGQRRASPTGGPRRGAASVQTRRLNFNTMFEVHYLYIRQPILTNKMERKAIHALLLSLAVITGAMTITTDAYAQTNTDRLITVVENTNNASSMLDAILDAINDGVESILAAIGSLTTSVNDGLAAIDADLDAVDTDLQAIHGDLEDVHGDLGAIDSDLQAIHGDLEEVHGDLTSIDGELHAMDEDLMTIHDDLTAMDADIESLTRSINTLGGAAIDLSAISQGNEQTQQGLQANSLAIKDLNTILMGIEATLDKVHLAVDEDAEVMMDEDPFAGLNITTSGPTVEELANKTSIVETTADDGTRIITITKFEPYTINYTNTVTEVKEKRVLVPTPITSLVSGKTTASVKVVDFAGDVKTAPSNNKYDSTNNFKCNNDVFITQVTLTSPAGNANTGENVLEEVYAQTYRLFERDVDIDSDSTTAAVDVHSPANLGNFYLRANTTFAVSGEANGQYDIENGAEDFMINEYVAVTASTSDVGDNTGFTKTKAGEVSLYTVEFEWISTSATTCTIDTKTAPADTAAKRLLVPLTAGSAGVVTYTAVNFDCGAGIPSITAVKLIAGTNLNFATVTIAGATNEFKFDSTGALNTDRSTTLPITLTAEQVPVAGTGVGDILVELMYNTDTGASCSVVTG